ncbi:MAG: hypothetical protein M5U15_11795 [Kiritimatiellae bacterium]|nr:hypothetical protein [Kiritimatiellia bacterium]
MSSALLVAALALSGCQALMVREVEKPLDDTVLMVARGQDETVLSWKSRRGMNYMVLYSDSRSSATRWQPLPNASMVRGTGAAITVHDAVPAQQPRFYRLEVIPTSGRKP